MVNIRKKKEEELHHSKYPNSKENHRTQELDVSNTNFQYPSMATLKPKLSFIEKQRSNITWGGEKKIDNSTMNHLRNNRRHPIPSRSFHSNTVLAPSPARNPQLTPTSSTTTPKSGLQRKGTSTKTLTVITSHVTEVIIIQSNEWLWHNSNIYIQNSTMSMVNTSDRQT
jgi:hypothetical protein